MVDLDALEEKVNELDDASSHFRFIEAFKEIEDAVRTNPETDKDRIQEILGTFRNTLATVDLPQLDDVKARSRKLDEKMTDETLGDIVGAVAARNDALDLLQLELNKQADKAKAEAKRLEKLIEFVNKGTKTVDELKSLISKLTDSSTGVKDMLKAFVTTAGNISEIFKPEEEEE